MVDPFIIKECLSGKAVLVRGQIQVFRCSGVQVFRCSGVQVFRCSGVPVFRCSGVPDFSSQGNNNQTHLN